MAAAVVARVAAADARSFVSRVRRVRRRASANTPREAAIRTYSAAPIGLTPGAPTGWDQKNMGENDGVEELLNDVS